jgi:hypothetical protein
MDACESLRDLLDGDPAIWTLVLDRRRRRDGTYTVHVRCYHIEQDHAVNVSPEAANVLHMPYDERRNAIRVRVLLSASAGCACVRELSRALYDAPNRIAHRSLS